jgi:hypothetical protein
MYLYYITSVSDSQAVYLIKSHDRILQQRYIIMYPLKTRARSFLALKLALTAFSADSLWTRVHQDAINDNIEAAIIVLRLAAHQ